MTTRRSTTRLTTAMVQVLAHPLRARLLGLLRVMGPSTASKLADQLGTNSGATSYHLRQLSESGLVEEIPDKGTTRERWWQASHEYHSWTESEHDTDPDSKAAADWLVRFAQREHARHIDDWLDVRTDWPTEWRDAADMSDYLVRVTPQQLVELNARVEAVIAEFIDEPEIADDPEGTDSSDGAELVGLIHYAFPYRAVRP